MASVFHRTAGALRRRMEGIHFAGLWLTQILPRWPRMKPLPGDGAAARWMAYATRGLAPLRDRWWVPLQLELKANVWRYVSLLETFDARNRLAPDPSFSRTGPKRILVVNLGHMGDLLHTMPMIAALRSQRPDAHIALLTGPWNEALAARIPGLDEILLYAPRWEPLSRGHSASQWSTAEERQWLEKAAAGVWDEMISCSSGTFIDWFLAVAFRPARWIGAGCCPRELFKPTFTYIDMPYESRAYEADRLLGLLKELGYPVDETATLRFEVREDDHKRVRNAFPDLGADPSWVVMGLGAGWPGKLWPAERFGFVADRLIESRNCRVAVVGSRGEQQLAAAMRAAMKRDVLDLTGRTDIGQLAALLESCSLFIGNDSGPLHLAAAVGAKTIGIYGPGFPDKWAPRGTGHRVFQRAGDCPCYPWHPRAACEKAAPCIADTSVDDVVNAASVLMG